MRSITKDKKGFAALIPLVLSIGVAIIVLGLVASMAASTRSTLADPTLGYNTTFHPDNYTESCNDDCGEGGCNWTCYGGVYNVTNAGLLALITLAGYWGIIVTIGVFVIILGALMTMFQGGQRR